jgi:hypothetical protein
MAEYSRIARGRFVSTGAAKPIYLPFKPDFVEFENFTASAAFRDNSVLSASWDEGMGQGFALTKVRNTTYQTDSVILNGISTFDAGLAFQYGASKQVVSASKAAAAVIEVTAHGYSTGDVVVFQGMYSTQFSAGMPQIDGMPFAITVIDANSFSIPWNTNQSAYTALAASPTGAFVKKVLYPFLYAPGVSNITAITRGTTTTVVTTAPHNCVVGQQVAFRIPELWGTVELNSLPNEQLPGSPKYGYVVSVTDSRTVVVSINSASYTAYDSNIAVSNVPGLTFPQMVAVGDVNSGGMEISSGSVLYPPPQVNGVNTINGPAIKGAFVNNTRSGFIIGAGLCVTDTAAVLVGAASDVIYWRAFKSDLSV